MRLTDTLLDGLAQVRFHSRNHAGARAFGYVVGIILFGLVSFIVAFVRDVEGVMKSIRGAFARRSSESRPLAGLKTTVSIRAAQHIAEGFVAAIREARTTGNTARLRLHATERGYAALSERSQSAAARGHREAVEVVDLRVESVMGGHTDPMDQIFVDVRCEERRAEVATSAAPEMVEFALANASVETRFERWELARRIDAKGDPEQIEFSDHCPICHRPRGDESATRCGACGAEITPGAFGWILDGGAG